MSPVSICRTSVLLQEINKEAFENWPAAFLGQERMMGPVKKGIVASSGGWLLLSRGSAR